MWEDVGDDPRGPARPSYLRVDAGDGTVVADDTDWSTTVRWRRDDAGFTATVTWRVPEVAAGAHRVVWLDADGAEHRSDAVTVG